jgi:predicted enzyme related to lactoylglutathione lyase
MGAYQRFAVAGRTIGGICAKPATAPEPFWLFYFNIGDVEAAAERVRAGGGQILEGPFETPGGNCVARCTDPQGAMFALEGRGKGDAIGYFERAASPGRGAA